MELVWPVVEGLFFLAGKRWKGRLESCLDISAGSMGLAGWSVCWPRASGKQTCASTRQRAVRRKDKKSNTNIKSNYITDELHLEFLSV